MKYLLKKKKELLFMEPRFDQIFKKNRFDLIIANPADLKEYTDRDAFSQIKDHEYFKENGYLVILLVIFFNY